MSDIEIPGLCGSTRKDSYNGSALKAAQALLTEGAQLDLIDLHGIPPRRVVMRAALASGCSLWKPIDLSMNDPKNGGNTSITSPTSVSNNEGQISFVGPNDLNTHPI